MQKSIRINYTVASAICLVLVITVVFANIYPVGYWDKAHLYEENYQAGYGYNSLVEVVGNGFFWEADEVPVEFDSYKGEIDSGYFAMGLWWISVLYIPIFLGIIYLGWLIAQNGLSILFPGRKNNSQNEDP